MLHDLSNELSDRLSVLEDAPLALSVTYVANSWSVEDGLLTWFLRKPGGVGYPIAKRGIRQEASREKPTKRRKVRDVKKVDVGSLLSTFL